jgi:hypothetical protein
MTDTPPPPEDQDDDSPWWRTRPIEWVLSRLGGDDEPDLPVLEPADAEDYEQQAPKEIDNGSVKGAPSLKALGNAGTYYFLNEPYWVARHVETLEILGLRSAIRRLTIDLVLPRHPAAWVAKDGDEVLYCLPVARMSKGSPTAFIDLTDEEGRSLPLLSRRENARISRRALGNAVAHLLGHTKVDAALGLSLDLVVESDELPAEFALGVFRKAQKVRNQLREGPAAQRLSTVVTALQANSFIWVVLRGRPGAHRLVKLCYRIGLQVPVVPARREHVELIDEIDYELKLEGPIDVWRTLRNLTSRLTAAMGWDAIDLTIDDPATQDPNSYHFQVRAPSGLRLEEIRPLSIPEGDNLELFLGSDHVYLRGADRGQTMPLTLRMRVHRRGLLNLSVLASALITTLLWIVQARQEHLTGPTEQTNAQIAAAVLVVVPAFLVVWASRPAENPLASTLLTGVRFGVLTCGLAAAASAAAVGGVRFSDSLSATLIGAGVVSSAATAGILVGWAGSFARLREWLIRGRRSMWGDERHDTWRLGVTVGAAAAVGLAGWALALDVVSIAEHQLRAELAVGLLGLAAGIGLPALSRTPIEDDAVEQAEPPLAPPIPRAAIVAAVTAVAGCVVLLLDLGMGAQGAYPIVRDVSAAVAGIGLLGVLVNLIAPLSVGLAPWLSWDAWDELEGTLQRLAGVLGTDEDAEAEEHEDSGF